MDLVVRVREIEGHCRVYKVGDTFALESGYELVLDIRPVCIHLHLCCPIIMLIGAYTLYIHSFGGWPCWL